MMIEESLNNDSKISSKISLRPALGHTLITQHLMPYTETKKGFGNAIIRGQRVGDHHKYTNSTMNAILQFYHDSGAPFKNTNSS